MSEYHYDAWRESPRPSEHVEQSEGPLVRALVASDLPTRASTLYGLFSGHQREAEPQEAEITAIPALLALLEDRSLPGRDAIVMVLADLARASQPARYRAVRMPRPLWSLRVRAALQAGLQTCLRLLAADEPDLSVNSAYLLSWLEEEAEQILPQLAQRLEQVHEPRVRAALLLSSERLGGTQPTTVRLCKRLLQAREAPLVRLVAAMALARLLRAHTPARALHLLVRFLADPQLVASDYDTLPWARNSLVSDISEVLRLLPPAALQFAIPTLLEALAGASLYSSLSLVRTLHYLAFSAEPDALNTSHSLDSEQQQILAALRTSLAAWHITDALLAG